MALLNKISKKRGLSSIIGTLLMVAVVATIGSVILFQALNGINDFNYYLSFLTGSKNSSYESAIIEHVRFNPTTNDMDIWVRNTGTVQLEISTVTIVKMDTQNQIIASHNRETIPISQMVNIDQQPIIPAGIVWNDPTYSASDYRIAITTTSGNSFETTARPFNT